LLEGERLIADVYNSLRRNEALWKTSLLVVLYDEHGGFYDHVTPPDTVPPDHHVEEYGFNQLGVRVPAILVSPFVKKGVIHTQFDHTSLLKYLSDKWGLGPLGARVAAANSFGSIISPDVQDLGPPTIPEPVYVCDIDATALQNYQSERPAVCDPLWTGVGQKCAWSLVQLISNPLLQ